LLIGSDLIHCVVIIFLLFLLLLLLLVEEVFFLHLHHTVAITST